MSNLTKKQKIRRIVETALMLALSTILAELPVIPFPLGGSVTIFSQVPMVVISYRYGVKWGIFSGLAMGVIQALFGLSNITYFKEIVSGLIVLLADYIIAFGALGLGGMFRNVIKNQPVSIALGGAVVSVIRFICHFISGVTVWADYTNGAKEVWLYSLGYNGGYMLPELIITVIGCAVLGAVFDLKSPDLKILKSKK